MAAAGDIVSNSLRGAYWMLGDLKTLTQGLASISFVNTAGLLKA